MHDARHGQGFRRFMPHGLRGRGPRGKYALGLEDVIFFLRIGVSCMEILE